MGDHHADGRAGGQGFWDDHGRLGGKGALGHCTSVPIHRLSGGLYWDRDYGWAQENGGATGNLTFIHEVPRVEEEPMAILVAGLQGECRCDLVL